MKYALLQQTLDIPPVENLKRAFRSLRSLTDADAHILARDAFGILVKNLSAADAGILQQALQAEGIGTEMVAEALLPQMPPTKFIRKVQATPDALLLHDALGRPFPLEWQHILLIAAGNVRQQDFIRQQTVRKVTRYTADGNPYTDTEVDYSSKEESNFHFLVELVITRSVLRYSIDATKPFLFQHCGPEAAQDPSQAFAQFMRNLLRFAPHAAINRGAYYLRENTAPTAYPTKNAFYEEIIWLLWRMKQNAS